MSRAPARLLVVTRHTPLASEDGAGAYLSDILAYLSEQGLEIHVLWLAPHERLRWQGCWQVPEELSRFATLHLPGAWNFGRRRLFPAVYLQPRIARLKHFLKQGLLSLGLWRRSSPVQQPATGPAGPAGRPGIAAWMSLMSPAESAQTRALARRLRPDILLANYAWMSPAFETCPEARRVCLHHDVAWQRALLLARTSGGQPGITRDTEARWLAAAEHILCISEHDRVELQHLAPAAKVLCCPKAASPAPEALPGEDKRLLFVGSDNVLNKEGLAWFLSEVWPACLAEDPGLTLDVCGSVCSSVRSVPAGVQLHGRVASLSPHYARAGLVVIPLLQGSGLNIKLVEAAAHGKAIVASPSVLLGGAAFGEALRLGENAQAFKEAIVQLSADASQRRLLGGKALACIAGHFSPSACYGPILDAVLASRRPAV